MEKEIPNNLMWKQKALLSHVVILSWNEKQGHGHMQVEGEPIIPTMRKTTKEAPDM